MNPECPDSDSSAGSVVADVILRQDPYEEEDEEDDENEGKTDEDDDRQDDGYSE